MEPQNILTDLLTSLSSVAVYHMNCEVFRHLSIACVPRTVRMLPLLPRSAPKYRSPMQFWTPVHNNTSNKSMSQEMKHSILMSKPKIKIYPWCTLVRRHDLATHWNCALSLITGLSMMSGFSSWTALEPQEAYTYWGIPLYVLRLETQVV